MTPEANVLAALDALRDALAVYLAEPQREPEPPAGLLTIAGAARALSVSRSTVTRWADHGGIPTVTLDGRRWIARADIDRLAGTIPATSPK